MTTIPTSLRRTLLALSLPTAAVALSIGVAAPASADTPSSGEIVEHVGDPVAVWTVPSGTNTVHLHIVGASGAAGGGGAGSPGGQGGHGGIVDEDVPVKAGQTIQLMPGSTRNSNGEQTAYLESFGGIGGSGDLNGPGGRGGAASLATLDGHLVGIAAGGGGGGGGGAVYSYAGGNGGDARHAGSDGSGAGAGSGGSGNVAGNADQHRGERASDAPSASFAGGGGGGGAGWNGDKLGGGHAGGTGTYGGGGGGGAAGGLSWGAGSDVSYDVSAAAGDGEVVLDWAPATTSSTLTAPTSAPLGTPVTLTDTITATGSGGQGLTGQVSFEMVDINTYEKTVLGTAKVVDGVATLTTRDLPRGQYKGIHAVYTSDAGYQGSTSNFVYPTITAPIMTVAIKPNPLAFGNVTLNTRHTKTVTLANTGSVDWVVTSASTDNGDVKVAGTTCGSVKPGDSCTVTATDQPHKLGTITAHIAFSSNFPTVTVPVTATGVAPAPTVTKISPKSGSHRGGTRVTITGTNFVDVTAIKISGKSFKAVSCASSTSCKATTPSGTVGTHAIRVTTKTGTSAAVTADRFTYV